MVRGAGTRWTPPIRPTEGRDATMRTTLLSVTVVTTAVVVSALVGKVSGLREALREHCADKYIGGVSDGLRRE